MLQSPVPIVTLWGEDGVMIYNDAYSVFAGGRHPCLLGSKVREGWPEVADFNDNVMQAVFGRGETLSYRDQELTLFRHDRAEQVWMNLDYSPVLNDNGTRAGVIAVVVETSGKVRAEQRLSGERERLRQMFDAAPGFTALVEGPEHRFAMTNRAYRELVGREVMGKPVAEALPEVAEQGFVSLLDNVAASGEPYVGRAMPVRLLRDGQVVERFVDFVFQPMSIDGDTSGVFVQGHDVTEHKRSEALRIAHNEVLQQALLDQPLATALEGLIRTVEKHSGSGVIGSILTLDESGDHLKHGAAPNLPDAYNRAIDGTRIGPKAGSCGTAAFTGKPVFVSDISADPLWDEFRKLALAYDLRACWSTPIRSGSGEVLGTFAMYHRQPREPGAEDLEIVELVTRTAALVIEHKRAEAALRESEERFRLVAERAPVMLWMSTPEGKCAYLNKAQREFWGVSKDELDGFDWSSTVHEEDRDALFGPYADAMKSHASFSVEARYRRADGEWRWFRTDAQPRLGPSGEFLGMIGVNVDETEIRQTRERLEQLNENLEARVVEEIAERRAAEVALQQAQKLEAVGKLTGGIAHDFNNLLQIISGNLQLLASDVPGNARAEARLANAMAGVNRGAKLASQLLAFGRRQPLEPKVVNVGRLVAGMEDLLRRSIGEAVEIETVISAGLWNAFVDPTQIESALLNLAINARDAMDGVGKLTIEAGNALLDPEYAAENSDVKPGQYVMLAVTDTGAGIPPELVEQVFEPFFTTKAEGKGSGLGLSMVYGFVKQSGGHVKIYSEVGHGTSIKMYLPRIYEDEDQPSATELVETGGGSETILVVEDDEEVRATVTDMLAELGYNVLTAKDAGSALPIIESGVKIDLLFTDVVMPGPLRSPELARKAKERMPSLAILFTSGYTENAIVHGGRLDAGVNLLTKPYSRQLLASRVRRALDERLAPVD
ncbi:PAS domain S-box protein [Sphingomonas segetis]|uniref:PAS domain S-box protein n=1 Tax=Sphingomonas segetis TaxID=1104779 RepID=UPI0012D319C9|nr:PAS domain S-box protein [Sphingomonas segetis]